MKCQRREKIGVPLFHVSPESRRCPRSCARHGGVTAGPTTPSITPCLRGSQGCGRYVVNVRALSCCACSLQEKPSLLSFSFSLFFFFSPSLVTGKGSIFSFHIWSYGALPVSSSLLMLYKHLFCVGSVLFGMLFLQFSLIVGVASENALFKRDTNPLKVQHQKEIGLHFVALLHRTCLFALLFMIWTGGGTQLLM